MSKAPNTTKQHRTFDKANGSIGFGWEGSYLVRKNLATGMFYVAKRWEDGEKEAV